MAICMLTVGVAAAFPHGAVASADTAASTVLVPRSIDRTGTVDVTDDLNKFLAQQGDDVVVALRRRANYRVDGTLLLSDKKNFVLDGNGARIFTDSEGYRERAHLTLSGGDSVSVRDLVIEGAHPNPGPEGDYVAQLEAQHGIQILGTNKARITSTQISNVYGDFVYLGRDQRSKMPTYRRPATNAKIVRNHFFGSGRQGIALTSADRVAIRRNDISQVRRSMFDFEPNADDGSVTNVVIARNVIGDAGLNSVAAGGKGTVDHVMVRRNSFVKQPINAMIKAGDAVSRADWSFIRNVSDRGFGSTLGGAIWAVGGVENLAFIRNTQPMNWNRDMAGVQSDDASCGIVARDNIMRYATAQSRGGSKPCAE